MTAMSLTKSTARWERLLPLLVFNRIQAFETVQGFVNLIAKCTKLLGSSELS